jgi:signal transduction histidine kinase
LGKPPAFPARLKQVFDTGEPYLAREVPVELARREGGARRKGFFDLVYQPVRAPDGTVDGILTLLMEVTEQLKLREEAQRQAREEGARRDFEQHLIGIVSHDLRTPLSAISLGLQALLRREGLDARTLQSLVRLQSSTERAVRMVRDLLDFTQARLGGGLKIERIPMVLHLLVRGVVEEHQVTHPTREVLLEQGGDGRGAWDTDRVAQVLGNLLGNALKYSPEDTPVSVRSLGEENGGRLEVHNGGAPIPPEAMGRLFQPLQRAMAGADLAGRSVGLGLYIVDQIVWRDRPRDVDRERGNGLLRFPADGTAVITGLTRHPARQEGRAISSSLKSPVSVIH